MIEKNLNFNMLGYASWSHLMIHFVVLKIIKHILNNQLVVCLNTKD